MIPLGMIGVPRTPRQLDQVGGWVAIVVVVGLAGFCFGRVTSPRQIVYPPSVSAGIERTRSNLSEESAHVPGEKRVDAHSYEVPFLPGPRKPTPPPLSTGPAGEAKPKPAAPGPSLVIEDFLVREPNSNGSIWFDGEVHNLGPGSPRVKIIAKAYSINEVLLDSKEFYVSSDPIPPGESRHFNSYVKSTGAEEIRKIVPQIVAY